MASTASPGLDTLERAEADVELCKEALTMALYVAICLLAALAAVSEETAEDHVFEIVWGTTVGLAVAHWFAFRVSARFVAQGRVRRHDALAALAQLIGAVAVALVATVPALIVPASVELDVVELVLTCFIGVVGYCVARSSGANRWRSIVHGAFLLVAAGLVVFVKIALTH
jgi:uncharacterized membrane-anchored protein